MSSKTANLRVLADRRDRLRADMDAIRARLDEVESLMRLMGGDPPPETQVTRKPRRGDLKDAVIALCDEAGESGLSSGECVNAAKAKHGLDLQSASVSSLLSRLKSDGILMYDGERYRMKRFAGPRSAA